MKPHRDAIYDQTGGCYVGRSSWWCDRWTWPLAGIYLYRGELVLSMAFRRYCFPRAKLTRIRRCSQWLWPGLRIEHTAGDVSPFIVFIPVDRAELEEALEVNAFPVAIQTPDR